MNFSSWAVIVFILGVVGWFLALEIRLRILEERAALDEEELQDNAIEKKDSALSARERDALLKIDLGDGNSKT